MSKSETIKIDGVEYVRRDASVTMAPETDGLRYCVVRTYSAGVHIGFVEEFGDVNSSQYARLLKSRRLHQWSGACSLSQVAMDGADESSRIAMELPEIELTDVIEVIPCSEKAAEFFQSAKAWKK